MSLGAHVSGIAWFQYMCSELVYFHPTGKPPCLKSRFVFLDLRCVFTGQAYVIVASSWRFPVIKWKAAGVLLILRCVLSVWIGVFSLVFEAPELQGRCPSASFPYSSGNTFPSIATRLFSFRVGALLVDSVCSQKPPFAHSLNSSCRSSSASAIQVGPTNKHKVW